MSASPAAWRRFAAASEAQQADLLRHSRAAPAVREVLERVTLADLVDDRLPPPIATLARLPESWVTR